MGAANAGNNFILATIPVLIPRRMLLTSMLTTVDKGDIVMKIISPKHALSSVYRRIG